MAKNFIKKKEGPNQAGPKYRTSDFFKAKTFSPKSSFGIKFNPSTFKTQHKG